jgi:hypothetical protein
MHRPCRERLPLPATRLPLGRFSTHAKQQLRDATASRRYRGHRIRAIQVGSTWHASVHGHTGSILKIIESTSLLDAMAQAEWYIETRFAFRPPSRGERKDG